MKQATLTRTESAALLELRRLNALLARSRRRMMHRPDLVFYVRRFLHVAREVAALEALLLLGIPSAHDEAVYALSRPASATF
ncbi:hypothetical protein [Hymenobacter sp. UYP22]|uniref:hypothetical protein n=1 Tax=Hymenobacter sp. UYP22 TaxID=3156348 RepID=UPI003398833A